MKNLFDTAIAAAISAGKTIMEVYSSAEYEVAYKDDNSPLTRADMRAHTIIVDSLIPSEIPILSEESPDISYAERSGWKQFWMVDPLDGTKEFIKKNGEFTVNIALIEYGRPTFGIVYVPVSETLYVGGKHILPYVMFKGVKTLLPKTAPITLENKIRVSCLRVLTSREHLNNDTKTFTYRLESPSLVSKGSSLKFMWIAEGRADIYPRFAPTMEWDTAASHAILASLGYHLVTIDTEQELKYNKENLLNPYFICY